jgi:hypothetical protein
MTGNRAYILFSEPCTGSIPILKKERFEPSYRITLHDILHKRLKFTLKNSYTFFKSKYGTSVYFKYNDTRNIIEVIFTESNRIAATYEVISYDIYGINAKGIKSRRPAKFNYNELEPYDK